jgi:hypothetical protein
MRALGMNRRAVIYFAVIGVVAAAVMTVPQIVLLGLAAGILPGYILGITPSLFCYSLVWWPIRGVLLKAGLLAGLDPAQRFLHWTAGTAAVAITLIPAVLVPRAFNVSIELAATALCAEDHENAGPIAFPTVVALRLPRSYVQINLCEALCQHLLYNGVVSRVIVGQVNGPDASIPPPPNAYWIERRDRCPEPDISIFQVAWPTDFPLEQGGPLTRVRARIAAGECLLRDQGTIEEAGATITVRQLKKGASIFDTPWSLEPDTVEATRLEIVESDGRVLYRRTEVTTHPLMVPLLIDVQSGLLTTVTYVGWARPTVVYAPIGPQGRDVMPDLLGAASRRVDKPEQ